jgi:hypothetical protein
MTAVVAFFATTPTKENKNDGNKLLVATHFCFKQFFLKKGRDNELVDVTLFAITTKEEKKCDGNKLATIIFFVLSKKKEKLGDNNKLVAVALFTTKNKRKKKKTTHLCRHLFHFK